MSLVLLPRVRASCLPSGAQANVIISFDVKWVNCLGGPPESGQLQMFETPFRVSTYVTECPSGAHLNEVAALTYEKVILEIVVVPPSKGMVASRVFTPCSSKRPNAISFPSGETVGENIFVYQFRGLTTFYGDLPRSELSGKISVVKDPFPVR